MLYPPELQAHGLILRDLAEVGKRQDWGLCPRLCREGIEASRCLSEISIVDDVVALEDRARFVTRQLHSDTLRHRSAYEVTNRGSSEIVRDARRTRTAR